MPRGISLVGDSDVADPALHQDTTLLAENARLRAENARLLEERAALAAFTIAAEPIDGRATNLARLTAAAATALGCTNAALYLYDPAATHTAEAYFAGFASPAEARLHALNCPPAQDPVEALALSTRRTALVAIGGDDRSRPRPSPAVAAQVLAIPLHRSGRIIGCLRAERPLTERPFGPQIAAFAADLAILAVLLIERADGDADARRRAVRADALREIGRELSAELDLDRFCTSASRHLTRLMDVQDCWIGLWDEAAGELTILLYIHAGERRDDFANVRLRPEEARGLSCALLTERRTIHSDDYLQECQRRGLASYAPDGEWDGLAWIGLPLLSGGRLVGAMAVERFHAPFGQEDVALLESLAGHLAASLENARLFAEQRAMAASDPLTGLANHRHIHERLEQELARAATDDRALTVAMLDLNNFKRYNDTYGHQAGDRLLRAVARALREEIGPADLAGRYGGDEFLLVLPDRDAPAAAALLDRIRARLGTDVAALTPGDDLLVTTSGGIATYPGDASTAHELVGLADAALYADKRAYHADRRS